MRRRNVLEMAISSILFILLASGVLLLFAPPLAAQEAAWPTLTFKQAAAGFEKPVHITHAGDGSARLFVVEQPGRIRIVGLDGSVLPAPFLDITGQVGCCGERGLLSVAFPADYAGKGHFYVNYTNRNNETIVARYRVTSDPNVADPGSEEVILTVKQPYENHNGGQLAFGPRDGYLYIGMGDGGSGGDPENRAQNPETLLGKMLRIDVESAGSGAARPQGLNYVTPATNPYTQTVGYRPEIWALGLRNPWRFAFDRQSGDLYMGDVGQRDWEEVNYQPASSVGGENYGWRILEGAHCYNPPDGCASPERYAPPIAEYDHGQGCSVTGGMVYQGSKYPALNGTYIYADYCSGLVWSMRFDGAAWQNQLLVDTAYVISTFGESEAGDIYLADYESGAIYEIAAVP